MRSLPVYPNRPIGSVGALAKFLGTTPAHLERLAKRADGLYREVPAEKKDGSPRKVYDARPVLKDLQKRIVKKFFHSVRYPCYLHGGIRDRKSPRDQVSNASMHTRAELLVLDDVADFFPSIRSYWVWQMWSRFFRLPPQVALILTALTTRDGELPQGAATSSYIANLIFWDVEYTLVNRLAELGFTYTRFVDDITLSAKERVPDEHVAKARTMIYGMLASRQCHPKRKKAVVLEKGKRMGVTGLVANGQVPVIDKDERRRIRAAVRQLERNVATDGFTSDLRQQFNRVMGRVMRMVRLKHADGMRLKQRLDALANSEKNNSLSERVGADFEGTASTFH